MRHPLYIPLLLTCLAPQLDAQGRAAGEQPQTFVLISGVAGGVAGMERLRLELTARGHRVQIIDPYRASIDSADVSFVALARRVDRVLQSAGITDARVVGHAHGAGVALRLAAIAPQRVASLHFLDAGALPSQRTTVLGSSLRLAPYLMRVPGGRSFVRSRVLAGLADNSGQDGWLDDRTRRAYTEPMLDRIDDVVAMAGRLTAATEPEPVDAVLRRVAVPLHVLVGDAPRAAQPAASELAMLRAHHPAVRIDHLRGVGHFPHEEAPAAVAAWLVGPARIADAATNASTIHPSRP